MAFTGKATYGTNNFKEIAEDVSDLITQISPMETPLLDRLGDSPQPAMNVFHEWLEDALGPNTLVTSSAVGSVTTATSVDIAGGNAAYVQPGMVLKNNTTGEYVQVSGVNAPTIIFNRAFGGTLASSSGAGTNFFLISTAELEGADVSLDVSQARSRKNNYTQIFKKDVIISGTEQAVRHLGNVTNEWEYQKLQRMRELLRDLEKAVINGITSSNSLGSATVYRTFNGIINQITTNVVSVTTLSQTSLNSLIQMAWSNGGTDCDLIVADANFKKIIDQWNTSRVHVSNAENTYRDRTSYFESTFGTQEVLLGRWMPTNSLLLLSTQRVKVLPLQGRSFFFQQTAQTGDSMKGFILGEYTVELRNEYGMAYTHF